MDRRGWLWKKKPSDKSINAEKPEAVSEPVASDLSSIAHLGDQDKCKIKSYVQISMESYKHMSGLEDQVQNLEKQVNVLEEKLSAAYSELNTKDNIVKQHAKVAEEAVSGWEKADAEVGSLRRQLESITLAKLSVDDWASHLDGALKECMKQIRNVKEESEKKLQDVILVKTQQWEKFKLELEAKINTLDQGLLRAAGENAALLRSLQESSNKIAKIEEENSLAEAEIELLKQNIQSYEKEITSLKYELHMVSKELDIRNEEKNISMRSAEVVNKQHIEAVKKIAKLEAECQRLRGLVRKKLPGPAALAQMKQEVETSGEDIREPRPRKTSSKNDSLHMYSSPEISSDNLQHSQSEFLTKQLAAMEEKTKALKEALAASNAELQASRDLYARSVGKLKNLEAQIEAFSQERCSPKPDLVIHTVSSDTSIAKNPSSTISVSEDGLQDPESPVESSAASNLDISDFRKGRNIDRSEEHKNANILELMDDFLEMEQMALLSDNANVDLSNVNKANESRKGDAEDKHSDYIPISRDLIPDGASYDKLLCVQDGDEILKRDVVVIQDSKVDTDCGITAHKNVADAISLIHHYVLILAREAVRLRESHGDELDVNLEDFSASLNQFMMKKTSLVEFVLKLSHALAKTVGLVLDYVGCKGNIEEIISANGLDNVAQKEMMKEMCFDKDDCIPQLSSDSEVSKEQRVSPGSAYDFVPHDCSIKEFKRKKSEKDDTATEHAEYVQDHKEVASELQEKKQLLEELKIQLASSEKSYSLAEIQLKCMTESYKSLETHVHELEAENKFLKEKTEALQNEIAEEKQSCHDALASYKQVEEEMQRNKKCAVCASNSKADSGINTRKDAELAAAEMKLAECQKTLHQLGRQLQALCPQIDTTKSHYSKRLQMNQMLAVKASGHIWSDSHGLYNSNEFDHTADICSVSCDMEENNLLLNSSMSSSQPSYRLTKSNSASSATLKHSHDMDGFSSSKGKTH